jgi:hypothetical protein
MFEGLNMFLGLMDNEYGPKPPHSRCKVCLWPTSVIWPLLQDFVNHWWVIGLKTWFEEEHYYLRA